MWTQVGCLTARKQDKRIFSAFESCKRFDFSVLSRFFCARLGTPFLRVHTRIWRDSSSCWTYYMRPWRIPRVVSKVIASVANHIGSLQPRLYACSNRRHFFFEISRLSWRVCGEPQLLTVCAFTQSFLTKLVRDRGSCLARTRLWGGPCSFVCEFPPCKNLLTTDRSSSHWSLFLFFRRLPTVPSAAAAAAAVQLCTVPTVLPGFRLPRCRRRRPVPRRVLVSPVERRRRVLPVSVRCLPLRRSALPRRLLLVVSLLVVQRSVRRPIPLAVQRSFRRPRPHGLALLRAAGRLPTPAAATAAIFVLQRRRRSTV